MFSNLSSFGRLGVVSLAALSCLSAAASAAPLGPVLNPTVAEGSAITPIPVEMGEFRGGAMLWPRHGGHWGGGGWNGGGHWHGGGWNGRHWHHGWDGGGWGGWGSGLALGLGLGVPLGYYGGYYNSYDPYYGDPGYYDVPVYRRHAYRYYDAPVYRPRAYRNRAYYRSYNNSGSVGDHCDNVYQTGPAFSGCQNR